MFYFGVTFLAFGLGQLTLVYPLTQCELKNGACTYNVNLNPTGLCQESGKSPDPNIRPMEITLPAQDQIVSNIQKEFTTVKSDHESRIKELESSIQKVMRNAITSQSPQYIGNQLYSGERSGSYAQISEDLRHSREKERATNPSPYGNTLLLQLQNQFNTLRKTLSERTADLLDARNKLNETLDLLGAAQKQAMDSGNKLVSLESESSVLTRENRILKNKLKHRSERLELTITKLNTTEINLVSAENQLYDVIRSEALVKEELETNKLEQKNMQEDFDELKNNHTVIVAKYKHIKRKIALLEEEMMDCFLAKTQTFCGFEDPDLCGFNQENGTDNFNWTRVQGRTPSANTGPENDHTCKDRNGHYMYIEASGRSKGNKARMRSPKYRGLNTQCIEFYYHMYGRNVGTLTVFSKILTRDEFNAVWRVFGNQGNIWIKASISVSEEIARSGYQLVFEGATETGYEGDISIDDFRIRDGLCAADAASLEATPAPMPDREKKKLFNEQLERYRRLLRRRQRLSRTNGKRK